MYCIEAEVVIVLKKLYNVKRFVKQKVTQKTLSKDSFLSLIKSLNTINTKKNPTIHKKNKCIFS